MKKGRPHLGILFSVSSYIWEDCDLHRYTTVPLSHNIIFRLLFLL